jgi:CheY-like chemotaxis protein
MTDTNPAPVIKEGVVLVAEDQPLVRATVVDVLFEAHFEAVEVCSADEAFELLQMRDDVDALLTDIEMPGTMDGLALATLARRGWPHLAIIVMSGKPLPHGHMLPERCSFHSKPCDVPALLAQLRELLAISRPMRNNQH